MFERFTDRARRVVVLAQDEARAMNHNYIGTEHILLGFLAEGESLAARALGEIGVELDSVREKIVDIVGRGANAATGHIPFTPRAKSVLDLALREALQLGHNYLGPEHLLLAMTRDHLRTVDGVGPQVLTALGHPPTEVRAAILRHVEKCDDGRARSVKTPAVKVFAVAPEPAPEGVWMAYYVDGSAARPFPTEVEALRYAVDYSCRVEFTKWGEAVGSPEKEASK